MQDELIERLCELEGRLLRNDPSLQHLVPFWSKNNNSALFSAYGFSFLEHDQVHQALESCLSACRHNTVVNKVTLHSLPEPELSLALEQISHLRNLKEVRVLQSNKSQSISWEQLLPVLQPPTLTECTTTSDSGIDGGGLRLLHVETCVTVSTQQQVHLLATALSHHTELESLALHILPRCSIQAPTVSVDAILQALCYNHHNNNRLLQLNTCMLTLGYDHNPYGKAMIQKETLQHFLQATAPTLQRLRLDNFGLGTSHLQVAADCLRHNTVLRELQLTRSMHITLQGLQCLHAALEESNYTLQVCCILPTPGGNNSGSSSSSSMATFRVPPKMARVQGQLSLLCRLNQLGRQRLWQDHDVTDHDWLDAIAAAASQPALPGTLAPARPLYPTRRLSLRSTVQEKNRSTSTLDACYALLRAHPQLCSTQQQEQQVQSATEQATVETQPEERLCSSSSVATRAPTPAILSKAETKLLQQKQKQRRRQSLTSTPTWIWIPRNTTQSFRRTC